MDDSEIAIRLEDFAVVFPGFRLGPLSLEVPPGERIALLGANGAGKSTLLRALAGLLPGYGGAIRVDGEELRGLLPDYRRTVGLLPEKVVGTPRMTVEERLDLIATFQPTWDRAYAETLLSELDLSGDARVGTLSKGMALKCSFVATEAYRPALLLLDEPTSGLDPVIRRTFLALLRRVLDADPRRTLIVSTHILEDVEAFAERVWVLREGRMTGNMSVSALRALVGDGALSPALYDAIAQV